MIDQDYENYEIIVIDDSSEDSTGEIISDYAKKISKIIHVSANSKPEGWMGKNWACMEGYRHAKGELYCLQMQIQNIQNKSYHYQFHI